MEYLKQVTMEIDKKMYNPIIAKQGDTARYILFRIINQDQSLFDLTDKLVRFSARKPDGSRIFNDCKIINNKGLVELRLTPQILAVPGWEQCELVIYYGTDVVSSLIFTLDIISSDRDDIVASTNEFSALTEALNSVQVLKDSWEEESKIIMDKYEQKFKDFEVKYDEKIGNIEVKYDGVINEVNDKYNEKINGILEKSMETESKVSNLVSANLLGAKPIEEESNYDSTKAINGVIAKASYGTIVTLSPGTYLVDKIVLKDGVSICSRGAVLKFNENAVGGLLNFGKKKDISIVGLTLDGGNIVEYNNESIQGRRIGIQIYNNSQRITIDSCLIRGFDSDGIKSIQVGYAKVHGKALKVSNTDVEYCYNGINLDTRSEYCQLSNITTTKNRVGLRVIGSNTQGVNIHCNDNYDGCHLLYTQDCNDSHSAFSNCAFNHNIRYSIYANEFSVGVSFSGCHSHANGEGFKLENCSGFTWSSGEIRYTPINIKGGGYHRFDNNIFENVKITKENDKTEFTNNCNKEGKEDSIDSNMPTYYIERSLSQRIEKVTQVSSIIFTTGVSMLFGTINSDIYSEETGVGKIHARGGYNIGVCVSVTNESEEDALVTLRVYKNAVVAKAVSINLKAGQSNSYMNIDLLAMFNSGDEYNIGVEASQIITLNNDPASKLIVMKC